MTSTSPDCSAVKRCCAVVGTYLVFSESPNIAAAMARQRSTSSPVHLPWLSAKEKPARPVLTAHWTKPLALTASKVVPAEAGKAAANPRTAAAARRLRSIAGPPVLLQGHHSKSREQKRACRLRRVRPTGAPPGQRRRLRLA